MFSESRRNRQAAFTLIELLIVIAIIAILALIAIPNFLEAQTRSKVSRAKADMRSLATGMEAYQTDYGLYPLSPDEFNRMEGTVGWPDGTNAQPHNNQYCFSHLTTPIAYMTRIVEDPFGQSGYATKDSDPTPGGTRQTFLYDAWQQSTLPWGIWNFNANNNDVFKRGYKWCATTIGPSRSIQRPDSPGNNVAIPGMLSGAQGPYVYDPSNGTMSFGHILRTNKGEYACQDWAQ